MQDKTLIINNEKIPITISTSSRRKKSLSFRVAENGLTVRIPVWINNSLLQKFIDKRQNWIYDNWLIQKTKNQNKKEYVSGEWFMYKWKTYRLKIIKTDEKNNKVIFNQSRFICYINKDIPEILQKDVIRFELNVWYKNKALEVISKEAGNLIKKYDFDVNRVIIKDYKSKYWQCRWKDIYFNYRIVQFPINIIRHIILHELCHIKHKNHWPKFWNLLNTLDSESQKHILYLKNNNLNF